MKKGVVALLLTILAVSQIHTLPASERAEKKSVVCYYGSWAVYRPGDGKFDVEDIDPFICTHIIYGFVGLTPDHKLWVMDAYNDLEENWGKGAMKRFTGLKNQNPELKALVAIGGWNEGSLKYSEMAATAASRRTFIDSVLEFLPSQNFDGLDLDWEYPADRGGKPEDKENFSLLMAELRAEFDKRGYLLTAAVSAGEATIRKAYDVPALARYLDAIHIMAYDFHGAFQNYAHHHAPLYEHPLDAQNNNTAWNVDYAVRLYNQLGAPYSKLVLGMGTYGRGFTLNDPTNDNLYAPASQPSPAGPYTREPGIIGYNEMCVKLQTEEWKVVWDDSLQARYAVRDRVWIGYEDAESLTVKAGYARNLGLAGVMVWSLETDDFRALCGSETYPLIKAMYRTINGDAPIPTRPPTTTTTPDPNAPTTLSTTTTTARPPPTGAPDKICKHNGNNPDPDDCRIFWNCWFNGETWDLVYYECGAGSAFNPEIGTCDWPYNVPGCS